MIFGRVFQPGDSRYFLIIFSLRVFSLFEVDLG